MSVGSDGRKKPSKIMDFLLSDEMWSRHHFKPRDEKIKEVGYPENLKIAAGLEERTVFQIPGVSRPGVEGGVEVEEGVGTVGTQVQVEAEVSSEEVEAPETGGMSETGVEVEAPETVAEASGAEVRGGAEVPEAKAGEAGVVEVSIGEVEYAILKSIVYGYKTVKDISKTLQIKPIIIEKRVNELINNGYVKYFQHAVLTTRGREQIDLFETMNPRDTWMPIDDFINSVSEKRKERSQRIHRILDAALLFSVIILIILLIYFNVLT